MSAPPPPTTIPPPDRVTCVRCGYDLRGLAPDGRCPECGLAVARSVAPSGELRHAPPHWLASLSWGARLTLTVPLLAVVYARFVGPRIPGMSLEGFFAGPAAFGLLFAAGVWLLTRPQRRFGASPAPLRWSLRLLSFAPLVQTVVTYCVMSGQFTRPLRFNPDAAMLGLAALPALLFFHLRGLARRVLDPSLAEHCAIVGVGGTLSFALAASGMFTRVPAPVEMAAGVGVLLFLLWSIYLMVRFAVAFARARRASDAAWGGSR